MQIQPACGSQLDVVGRQKGTPILGPVVMDTDGSSARAAALHLLMYAIETGLCVAVHELHANAIRDPKPKSKPEFADENDPTAQSADVPTAMDTDEELLERLITMLGIKFDWLSKVCARAVSNAHSAAAFLSGMVSPSCSLSGL